MYDSSEFKEWQLKMKEKENEEILSNQVKKKIEIELANDLFKEARDEKLKQNQMNVEKFKEFMGEKRQWRQEQELEELGSKMEVVREVRETRHNGQNEKNRLVRENHKLKQQMKNEIRENIILK